MVVRRYSTEFGQAWVAEVVMEGLRTSVSELPCHQRGRLLRAALGFLSLVSRKPELRLLQRWLNTWSGIGDL